MSRLVRIKRKYETWKDRSKDDLSLFLGSRSACSWYFFQMNFQNYRYIEAAYVRCDIQYDSEYFSCVKFYKCNIIPARCFQAFVVKKKKNYCYRICGVVCGLSSYATILFAFDKNKGRGKTPKRSQDIGGLLERKVRGAFKF